MKNDEQHIMRLLMHEKPVGIILGLKGTEGKYASILAKETDCTYTHTLKILDIFHKYGLVEFEKEGRIKRVVLTEKGGDIAHELEGLVRHLEKVSAEEENEESK